MDLREFGYDDHWKALLLEAAGPDAVPARVLAVHRGFADVISEAGDDSARIPSRFMKHEADGQGLPAVGDWVAIRPREGATPPSLAKILPRRTALSRRQPGNQTREQVIAANVDYVAVTMALAEDFNLNRLERYLLVVRASGAEPLVILTKSDLCDDTKDCVSEVEAGAGGATVLAVSAETGKGMKKLKALFPPGKTVTLIGSSGVGKSTLVNSLLGYEHMHTTEVRETDGKGRHTTSHRQLLVMPNKALLIDNPGIREIAAWDDGEEAMRDTFDDIIALGEKCRFRDCRHESEPGCAVLKAVENDVMTASRLENWRALGVEATKMRRDKVEATRIATRQRLRRSNR